MKKIIFSSCAVIIVLLAAAAVWYFYTPKKERAAVAKQESAAVKQEPEEQAADENKVIQKDQKTEKPEPLKIVFVDRYGRIKTPAIPYSEMSFDDEDQMQIRRGERVLFTIGCSESSRITFSTVKHGKDKCKWTNVVQDKNDFNSLLCDHDGSGKKRYMVLTQINIGATRSYQQTFILDAANDFKVCGKFYSAGGEAADDHLSMPPICGCRSKDDRVWFAFQDETYYGGARGGVYLDVQVGFNFSGDTPKWFWEKRGLDKNDNWNPQKIEWYSEGGFPDGREMAFYSLAYHLASRGQLKQLNSIARKHKFTANEINAWSKKIILGLFQSETYGKALLKFNGYKF